MKRSKLTPGSFALMTFLEPIAIHATALETEDAKDVPDVDHHTRRTRIQHIRQARFLPVHIRLQSPLVGPAGLPATVTGLTGHQGHQGHQGLTGQLMYIVKEPDLGLPKTARRLKIQKPTLMNQAHLNQAAVEALMLLALATKD